MKEVVSLLKTLAVKSFTDNEIVIQGRRDTLFTFKINEDNTLEVIENSFTFYIEELESINPTNIAGCILRLLRERHNCI